MTKTLYYACQASSLAMSLSKETLHNMCAFFYKALNTNTQDGKSMHTHDVTVFTNVHFLSLYRDNNSITFKKLHFETRF